MARSLNRVELIGNLTRDPELRYTPSGTAVCSFGLATNRSWTTDTGEKHDETEFHNIVSWNKLAELCSQFLVKGRKVYVEGRLATRKWTGQDGQQRTTVEIVISDMILLDSKGAGAAAVAPIPVREESEEASSRPAKKTDSSASQRSSEESSGKGKREKKEDAEEASSDSEEEVTPEDIPF
jgi:single-strand DNA-binding protein